MIYYFLIQLSISSIFLITYNKNIQSNFRDILYFLFIIFLIFFTGLRYEVGGDWVIYNENFINNSENFKIFDFSIRSDYGWELISFLLSKLTFGYVSINLISSAFFFIAFSIFISDYKYKLLAYLVSFPVIILILLMGFTRQAVAFSFLLLSLNYLFKSKFSKSFLFLLLGVFFHKSVFIFMFLYLLFPKFIFRVFLNRIYIFLLLILITLFTFFLLYEDFYQIYTQYFGIYITSNPESQGTYFRWLLNFIPSLIFIFFYKKFDLNNIQKRVYMCFSILIILLFFAISNYSTGIDRFLYYFSIIQIYVFSNLPILFNYLKKHIIFGIIIYYFIILYVWIFYSNHSYLWIPYKLYFFNI